MEISEEARDGRHQFDRGCVDIPGMHRAEGCTHAEAYDQAALRALIQECKWQVGHHLCNYREARHAASVDQEISWVIHANSHDCGGVVAKNHVLGEV